MDNSIAAQLCEAALKSGRNMYLSSGNLDHGAMRRALRQEMLRMTIKSDALDSDVEKIRALIDTVILAVDSSLRVEAANSSKNYSPELESV